MNPSAGLLASASLCLILSVGIARSMVVSSTEGETNVNIEGVVAAAGEKIGEPLPAGVIIATGVDGRALVKVADGLFIELQPDSQIVFTGIAAEAVLDAGGNPMPQASVTLVSGSLVLVSSPEALAQTSLLVVTPRGNLSPVNSGQLLVTADNGDPAQAAVTVAVLKGDALVTQTGGDTTPVGEGLAVTLKADGQSSIGTLAELPESPTYATTVQSTVTKVESLQVANPEPMQTSIAPAMTSVPIPTPTPKLTPVPTPTPKPTPIPTPTPKPTPTPTPTPKPTPTPSPTQTP